MRSFDDMIQSAISNLETARTTQVQESREGLLMTAAADIVRAALECRKSHTLRCPTRWHRGIIYAGDGSDIPDGAQCLLERHEMPPHAFRNEAGEKVEHGEDRAWRKK